MSVLPFRCGLVFLLILAAQTGVPLPAADRVALVIGNSAYEHGSPLRNPANDAADVAAALRSCGFTLVGDRAETELRNEALHARLEEFRRASAPASVALFFFSGHGVEVEGANYLLPVDAKVEEKFQVKHRTLSLDEVLESMAAGPEKLKIVILDCCRDNPLARSWSRSGSGGLAAPASTPGGTVLFYATAPGKTADDGTARNSPFSAVLKTALPAPGRELEQIFKEVGATVKRNTGGAQEPWMNSSFYGSFAFVPGAPVPDRGAELAAMQSVKDAEIERLKRELAAAQVMKLSAPAAPPATISLPVLSPAPVTPPVSSLQSPASLTNSLGMKFVPVPGTNILMSIWETRVQDYAAFAKANPGVDMKWQDVEFSGSKQGPDHPVVNVSWEDAQAFCKWLSQKEGKTYRLPTDHEWSVAVGIGDREDPQASPERKDGNIEGVYPWGTALPPPPGAGNYGSSSGSSDPHPFTAPVGSYHSNRLGLYDLGGNGWEWCEDFYDGKSGSRVLRGGSWNSHDPYYLLSSIRNRLTPTNRYISGRGFRVVLVGSGER